MRKTLIALLFAASLPTVALAMPEGGQQRGEERHGSQHQGGKHGMQMFKELNLSQDQRQAVGKLMREQMDSRQSITQRYLDKLPAADKQALQDELKAAKDKNQQAIRALLTPEQQTSYDAAAQKMAERHAEMAEFQAWKAQRAEKAE